MAAQGKFESVAVELESLLASAPKGAAPVGHGEGLVKHLHDLITAVRSGNVATIGHALKDVWDCLFGQPMMHAGAAASTPEQFKAAAAVAGIDWGRLVKLFKTILDLFT